MPLIGHSHRWAAGAIMLLGMFTCGLGSPGKDVASRLLAVLGTTALGLGVLAVVTGSLAALSLLVAANVLLWLLATLRHAHQAGHKALSV